MSNEVDEMPCAFEVALAWKEQRENEGLARYEQELREIQEWSDSQPINGVETEDIGGPFTIVYSYTADQFSGGEAVIGTDVPVPLIYDPSTRDYYDGPERPTLPRPINSK